MYGGVPRLYPTVGTAFRMAGDPAWVPAAGATGAWAQGAATTLTTAVPVNEARVNPPVFFRRAIKVVNGGYTAGTLRLPRNGTQGLSIVAENPLYVQGNYNAPNAAGTDFGATTGHRPRVGGGDRRRRDVAVQQPSTTSARSCRRTTRRRPTGRPRPPGTASAVISGKGLNFPRPTSNAQDHTDFGTDGGRAQLPPLHRELERRRRSTTGARSSASTLNRQAVGTYKCCDVVYSPPSRGYRFDTDFLTADLLPPRTPMFRDINTLTFRQLLRPNQ